jgi:predicted GIY-YIG superfamily endonuclease
MAFYVYMLHCSGKSYYVGHSEDYEIRFTQHCEGQNRYTSKRLPVELIWVTDFPTRDQAKEFEYKLKKWNRKKKAALAAGNIEGLKQASKKVNWTDYRSRKQEISKHPSASPSRPAPRAGRNEGPDMT